MTDTSTRLSSERVDAIFKDCLFKEGEDHSNAILVDGIVNNVGLHPARIESHKDEITSMLMELPDQFMKTKGEGWSFLNLCMDKHGNQWTGLHLIMEQLVLLGIAIGKVSYLMPHEFWPALPGGMPYVVIDA